MLILASDYLHSSEDPAKLKHQAKMCLCAKVCLLIFLPHYQKSQILPPMQHGEIFSLGSSKDHPVLGLSPESSFIGNKERKWHFPHWCGIGIQWSGLCWENICGTSLSSVTYACAFLNVSLKQPVSMENGSLVSGGPIVIIFMELGIQSSHFSGTTRQKIRYRVKQSFPGNMASSLADAS